MMVAMAAEIDLLLTEAKGGADGALGRLLEQYSQYLTLLARMQIGKRLQGKVDAADLVQGSVLNVHRQFPQFRGTTEAEFVAWLRRIMAGQFD
jgi:RNA polymerase sigma-70 factor (ECF subfamily)